MKALSVLAGLLVLSPTTSAATYETTVGMPLQIEQLVLPGTELEVKPLDNRAAPVVLRIVNIYPHGTAFRYDFSFYVLDPGTFDLKDYLRRKDGSSTADLPALTVTAKPLLPPGQVEPNRLALQHAPFLGGYRLALIGLGVLWVAGLLAILFVGRGRRRQELARQRRPVTMADRLRPLVERGMAGDLSPGECASLERSLLAYWKRRLKIIDEKPLQVFDALRRHEEAGPLLEQLEAWLHRPGAAEKVDIARLLKPYRELPAEEMALTA